MIEVDDFTETPMVTATNNSYNGRADTSITLNCTYSSPRSEDPVVQVIWLRGVLLSV